MQIFKLDYSSKRIFGLDVLRTMAILFVLLSHSLHYLPSTFSTLLEPIMIDGVAIFFVLSGFLIGGIMLKVFKNNITKSLILEFWIRRWFRTLPLYLIILSILTLLDIIIYNRDINYFRYFLFLQNCTIAMQDFFPESWSLAVEEWFYISFPILFLIISKLFIKNKLKTRFLTTICSVIILVSIFRCYKYFNLETKSYYFYDRYFLREVISRLDAIVYGVLMAWIKQYYPELWVKSKKLNFALFCIGILLLFGVHNLENRSDLVLYIASFTLTSIAVSLMIPFFDGWSNCNNKPIFKIVTTISITSYSLYLINLSVVSYWILDKLLLDQTIKFILFWVISISLSILLLKTERLILKV